MRNRGILLGGSLLFALGLALGSVAGDLLGGELPAVTPATAWAQASSSPPGSVLLAYGVGGVLTADGRLFQYRPDVGRWLPIDEAFREEGRETNIVPLPVRAEEIRQMESFGFLVTRSGEIWLYEMSTDRWQKLSPPA